MKRTWMFIAMAFVIATASIPEGMAQQTQTQIFKIGDLTITVRDITPAGARGKGFGGIAVKDSTFYAASTDYLWTTTNAGKNWVRRGPESGLRTGAFNWVQSVALIDSGYVVAGTDYGLFRSTNKGETWQNIFELPGGGGPFSSILATKNKTIFLGDRGIYRSVNNGNSWVQVASDSETYPYVWRMTQTATGTILAGISSGVPTSGRGVLISTDNGERWTLSDSGLDSKLKNIGGIASQPGIFPVAYVVTEWAGAYKTTDDGKSWKHIDDIPEVEGSAAASTPIQGVFLGFSNFTREPLYRQTGAGWAIVPGFIGHTIESIAPFGLSGVVVGMNDGVFLVTFENPTKVKENSVPDDFRLEQNFPNPFNPSTTIEFSVPKSGFVTLKVTNLIGQEVSVLVNGEMSAGVHRVQWDGSRFPSGIYFYQLRAGTFSEAKRMLLVK